MINSDLNSLQSMQKCSSIHNLDFWETYHTWKKVEQFSLRLSTKIIFLIYGFNFSDSFTFLPHLPLFSLDPSIENVYSSLVFSWCDCSNPQLFTIWFFAADSQEVRYALLSPPFYCNVFNVILF